MATHSSILAWKIHGQRSPVGYSPWRCKELDTTEQLKLSFSLFLFTQVSEGRLVDDLGAPGVSIPSVKRSLELGAGGEQRTVPGAKRPGFRGKLLPQASVQVSTKPARFQGHKTTATQSLTANRVSCSQICGGYALSLIIINCQRLPSFSGECGQWGKA